jgi:hypothetical protein
MPQTLASGGAAVAAAAGALSGCLSAQVNA